MPASISDILALKHPIDTELIVFDLTNFALFSRSASSSEVFQKMRSFNEMTSKFIYEHGGLLVKFLGDAGLCLFPKDLADIAITSMTKMKTEVDVWLKQNIPGSHLAINCHLGNVTVGPTPGYRGQQQIYVAGETINVCFTLSKRGFAISPQAFRSLKSDTRKHFRKFTSPIVYHLNQGETP